VRRPDACPPPALPARLPRPTARPADGGAVLVLGRARGAADGVEELPVRHVGGGGGGRAAVPGEADERRPSAGVAEAEHVEQLVGGHALVGGDGGGAELDAGAAHHAAAVVAERGDARGGEPRGDLDGEVGRLARAGGAEERPPPGAVEAARGRPERAGVDRGGGGGEGHRLDAAAAHPTGCPPAAARQ
jgi:hypothetical protein